METLIGGKKEMTSETENMCVSSVPYVQVTLCGPYMLQ